MHPLQIALSRALTLAEKKPKNAGQNSGKGNGKGNGVADKADTATNGTTTPDAGGDDGGLIGTLGNLIWDHKWLIPVLFLAACIGINYLWKQYRNKQSMRGVAVRPLGPILSDITKFARVEDKRPLHPKLPDKITATRVYGILTLLIIISLLPKVPNLPLGPLVPGLILTLILGSRYSKIARARRSVLNQMFAVANSECRYPKGSELAPWNYVQIAGWVNFTQPGQTIINIPAAMQSEDIRTREKFERNFNGTVSEENAWTYKWESAKNRLVCEPAAFLPNMAPYPGPGEKWDEIPVGVQGDGSQAIMPLSVAPHALVCGPTGSGKSVLQRMILFHVLSHSETWRVVAIDMKKVEMAWLRKYEQVLKVATDLEESVEVLRSLRAEMMRRYEEMEEAGVNHAKDLPNPPKAILCMIDETTVLLAAEGIKSDEGKERDALHAEAQMIIGELGRLSRASMIHVIMCFQRPDAKYLGGEIKSNFDLRIAAGRMDTTPSLMVLDSEAANRLPKVKGRGMIRVGGELETFQGYFAEQDWYDNWAANQQGGGAAGPDGAPEGMAEELFDNDSVGDGEYGDVPTPDTAPAPQAPGQPVPAEDEGAKRKRGLRGLAAKAAAKAQERAARLDAEAGLDVSADGWVDESVAAPGPVLVSGPSGYPGDLPPTTSLAPSQVPGYPSSMGPVGSDIPTAPVGIPQVQPSGSPMATPVSPVVPPAMLPSAPPAQPVLPVMSDGAGHEFGKGLAPETFDFDALLVDVDEFDDYDDFDSDEAPYGDPSVPTAPPSPPTVPAPAAAPPVPAATALVEPFQPGGALPTATPPTAPALVQPFQPGAALPTATPPATPLPVPEGGAGGPATLPPGLPVRPALGLPTQPPETP